jgi:hypothetical protein
MRLLELRLPVSPPSTPLLSERLIQQLRVENMTRGRDRGDDGDGQEQQGELPGAHVGASVGSLDVGQRRDFSYLKMAESASRGNPYNAPPLVTGLGAPGVRWRASPPCAATTLFRWRRSSCGWRKCTGVCTSQARRRIPFRGLHSSRSVPRLLLAARISLVFHQQSLRQLSSLRPLRPSFWGRACHPGFADDTAQGGRAQLRHPQDTEVHRPGRAHATLRRRRVQEAR